MQRDFYKIFQSDQAFFAANKAAWEKLLRRSVMGFVKFTSQYEDEQLRNGMEFLEGTERSLRDDPIFAESSSVIDIYIRSVRRAVLTAHLIPNNEEVLKSEGAKINYDTLVHNFFMLLMIRGRQTYPTIEDSAIFTEIQQLLLKDFSWDSITRKSQDLLNEIRLFLKYSNLNLLYKDFINQEEVRTTIVRRLQQVQTHTQERHKKHRQQLKNIVEEVARSNGLSLKKIEENVIDVEGFISDVLVEYKSAFEGKEEEEKPTQTAHFFFDSRNTQEEGDEGILGVNPQESMRFSLRKQVLKYLGLKFLRIDLSAWVKMDEHQQKSVIEVLFSSSSS